MANTARDRLASGATIISAVRELLMTAAVPEFCFREKRLSAMSGIVARMWLLDFAVARWQTMNLVRHGEALRCGRLSLISGQLRQSELREPSLPYLQATLLRPFEE